MMQARPEFRRKARKVGNGQFNEFKSERMRKIISAKFYRLTFGTDEWNILSRIFAHSFRRRIHMLMIKS